MAEVHVLPGVERRELGNDLRVDQVLEGLAEVDLVELVVVGKTRLGEQYVATTMADPDKAVGMLVRAQNFIVNADIETKPFETDEGPTGA